MNPAGSYGTGSYSMDFCRWKGLHRRMRRTARRPPFRAPYFSTCSAYALEAVEKYGAWKGGLLALRRLLKCHPFHRQKSIEYDPVP